MLEYYFFVLSLRTAAQSCSGDAIQFNRVSGHAEIDAVAASRHPVAAQAYALGEAVRMVAGSANDPPIDDVRLLTRVLLHVADGSGAGAASAGVDSARGGGSRSSSGGSGKSDGVKSGDGGRFDGGAIDGVLRVRANVGGCVAFHSGRNSQLVILAKQPPKAAVLQRWAQFLCLSNFSLAQIARARLLQSVM